VNFQSAALKIDDHVLRHARAGVDREDSGL